MKLQKIKHIESLPKNIEFSPEAGKILEKSILEYNEKDDQLPLLQHFVFRLWRVIDEYFHNRNKTFYIEPRHLFEAAKYNENCDENKNLLKLCLNNWAESYYRKLIDSGLEEKGINNFLFIQVQKDHRGYNQSRADINNISNLTGLNHDDFDKLIEIFTNPHSYFYIDSQDKVKVSHEAFIRGWDRFRELADIEARDLEIYKDTLLKKYLFTDSKASKEDLEYYNSTQFTTHINDRYYEKNLALNIDRRLLDDDPKKQEIILDKLVNGGLSTWINDSKNHLKWKRRLKLMPIFLMLPIVLIAVYILCSSHRK